MWFDTYYTADFFLKPQAEGTGIVLDQSEEIVKTYMDTGSWAKAGVTTQQGKRELFKVIDYHYTHCLPSVHEVPQDKEIVAPSSTE